MLVTWNIELPRLMCAHMNEADGFELKGSLGVASITELHDQSCRALENDGNVEVDMSAVTNVDASVIQLLLATKKRSAELNSQFILKEIPESVQSVMSQGGALQALSSVSPPEPK